MSYNHPCCHDRRSSVLKEGKACVDLIDTTEEPSSLQYADLRSETKALNRQRKQKQKYYAYRGVQPSWIGQDYYTLTLVSEEACSFRKSKKTKRFHCTAVTETEHKSVLESHLRKEAFFSLALAGNIDLAVSEAGAKDGAQRSARRHEVCTSTGLDATTIEAPRTLNSLGNGWLFSNSKKLLPSGLRFKLKVKTWTQSDNFEQKEFFAGGPDRRHSRGKKKVREKRNERRNLRFMNRGRRERDASKLAIGEEVAAEPLHRCEVFSCDGLVIGCEMVHGMQASVWDFEEEPKNDAAEQRRLDLEQGRSGQVDSSQVYLEQEYFEQQEVEQHDLEERSETLSLLQSLLTSSEIVIVERPRLFEDDERSIDFDAMSDLVDGFYDIEWDLLSDADISGDI